MRKQQSPPYLIPDGNLRRCSVCKMPFMHENQESLNLRFAKHVLAYHQPVQTSEDITQAAFRVVGEATRD